MNDALTGDKVVANTRADVFTELRSKIRELMEFANTGHNVHGVIKGYDGCFANKTLKNVLTLRC